ncbi:MAG: helix-turn-helix transcriptional regulator [Pseudomonadota bacterium]
MTSSNSKLDAELGELVRLYRLSSGLSQVELGEAAGISYQQIQKYESGANKVSVSRLFSVTSALGVAPSELLSELERRVDYDQGGAAPDVSLEALQFLTSRRGQQIVRAMATCEDGQLLDAFIDLFLSATAAERRAGDAERKRQGMSA